LSKWDGADQLEAAIVGRAAIERLRDAILDRFGKRYFTIVGRAIAVRPSSQTWMNFRVRTRLSSASLILPQAASLL
jgi:hypothetical protein